METKIYDVDYFIEKFKNINDSFWCTDSYIMMDKCCALGHCGISSDEESSPEADALRKIFSFIGVYSVQQINDLSNPKAFPNYKQPSPKQRILAALHDIKKMHQSQPHYTDITKELAVLPPSEVSDLINQSIKTI